MTLTVEEQAAVDQLTFERVQKRRCACKGAIAVVGEVITPKAIEQAVQAHQDRYQHRLWRAGGGMESMLTAEERLLQVPSRPPVRLRRTA